MDSPNAGNRLFTLLSEYLSQGHIRYLIAAAMGVFVGLCFFLLAIFFLWLFPAILG